MFDNKFQAHLQQKMFEKTKESPYRSANYQSLEHSKQSAIKQLELIFTFYAGKGSKYNYQELPQKYFTEMVVQLSQLAGMQKSLNRKSKRWLSISTLYYTKGRSKPLYFTQFLQLLPGLSKCMFCSPSSHKSAETTELQQEQATKTLLLLFQKMYHIIMQEEIYKRGLRSQEIEEDTKQFLLKLRDSFIRLYKVYFQYEVNLKDREKDYQNRSFQCFLEFMKDFDVFPKLISASQLFFIYNQVNSQHQHNHLALLSQSIYTKIAFPKLGEHFTLSRFMEGLILASHIAVSKLKRVQGEELLFSSTGLTQKQAVKMLFEYMQTMRSVKNKYSKYSKQRFSLIVYEEYSDYTSTREERSTSTTLKPFGQSTSSPEHKKSFFDILHKINI